MARFLGLACPCCGGRYLRREMDGRVRWQEYKCLSGECGQTFALYDTEGEIEA